MDYFRQTTHGTIRFCRKCNVLDADEPEFGKYTENFVANAVERN